MPIGLLNCAVNPRPSADPEIPAIPGTPGAATATPPLISVWTLPVLDMILMLLLP